MSIVFSLHLLKSIPRCALRLFTRATQREFVPLDSCLGAGWDGLGLLQMNFPLLDDDDARHQRMECTRVLKATRRGERVPPRFSGTERTRIKRTRCRGMRHHVVVLPFD